MCLSCLRLTTFLGNVRFPVRLLWLNGSRSKFFLLLNNTTDPLVIYVHYTTQKMLYESAESISFMEPNQDGIRKKNYSYCTKCTIYFKIHTFPSICMLRAWKKAKVWIIRNHNWRHNGGIQFRESDTRFAS